MFDLDNTLSDRRRAVTEWATEFCADHSLGPAAARQILKMDNNGYSDRRHVFEIIKSEFDPPGSVDELLVDYRSKVTELTEPTPGAVECLIALRDQGHRLAIVTNGGSQRQHAKVDKLGLTALVHAVVVSGDLGIEKPDAAIFESAAGAVGVPLGPDTWMVGDSPLHDIHGANRLGLQAAWLHQGRTWLHPSTPEGCRCGPTIQLDSLHDVAEAITATSSTT